MSRTRTPSIASVPDNFGDTVPAAGHDPDVDIARLLLRALLGATMVAHGVRHARSLEGTARWFGSIGFGRPRLQAGLSSVVEVGAGAALAAGAATPLGAAAVIGTMAVAFETVHRPNGYFITAEGWEYVGFIAATATAVAALGSGRHSVDRRLGIDDVGTPAGRAVAAGVLGIAGAAAQLALFWRRPTPVVVLELEPEPEGPKT